MHYLVMVIGEDALEQLEQFDENLEVEEYEVDIVTERDKQHVLDFYSKNGKTYTDFEECYEENGEDWNDNRYRKDEDGVWREYSRCNPDGHWDWREIGGRWAGMIVVKDGVEYDQPSFSGGWSAEDKQKVLAERRTDSALIKDIANIDKLYAYAVVKDGEWEEIEDGDDANKELQELLKSLDPATRITFVDCHC